MPWRMVLVRQAGGGTDGGDATTPEGEGLHRGPSAAAVTLLFRIMEPPRALTRQAYPVLSGGHRRGQGALRLPRQPGVRSRSTPWQPGPDCLFCATNVAR